MTEEGTDPLIGYQQWIDWMGAPTLTLSDVLPSRPRAMIVGLNPAPTSVRAGHYYQGQVGRRQLRRLVAAGLLDPADGDYFEKSALQSGIGFTDIVKRPTVGEKDVDAVEVRYGRQLLFDLLGELRVPLVICVFRHPADALLGQTSRPGFQRTDLPWGGRVFRMPGPFDAKERVGSIMDELREFSATNR